MIIVSLVCFIEFKNLILILFQIGYFDSDSQSLKTDLVRVADVLSEKFRFAYTTAKEVLDKAGHLKYKNF